MLVGDAEFLHEPIVSQMQEEILDFGEIVRVCLERKRREYEAACLLPILNGGRRRNEYDACFQYRLALRVRYGELFAQRSVAKLFPLFDRVDEGLSAADRAVVA